MSIARSARLLSAALCLMAILGASSPFVSRSSAQEWAPPRTVWVENAGHSVDGLFLDEWRTYPNMLGMPISEEVKRPVSFDREQPKQRIVQYYQNMAIVYVPEDSRPGWQVQGLALGREAMERDKKDLVKLKLPSKGSCSGMAADRCIVAQETGHSIRMGFKDYWETNAGERLLGNPISEEFIGPDGVTVQYFDNAVLLWQPNVGVKLRPIGEASAKAAKVDLKKLTNDKGLPVYDESLFVPPVQPVIAVGGGDFGPGPQQGGAKEIVVSISQQMMWAYEGGQLVISSLVSTGVGDVPETVTPTGYFSVLTKYDVQTMEGTISDEHYRVEDVPWVMYFDDLGNALHGTYWHSNFGTPMSHGCVNLPLDVAEFLFGWAPEGTPVTVLG